MKESHSAPACLNAERERLLDLLNFNKTIVRAKGSYLYTDAGEELLDFTSQYGAVPFGHNPEFLHQELIGQLALDPGNMIQPFQSVNAKRLSNKLIEHAPGNLKHVILACSGTEAVEAAVKMARAKTKRNSILSTESGFHGKTMAACLTTGNAYYREPFNYGSEEFHHIPFDDVLSLERELSTRKYAAFIVEPVQGEGGMNVPSPGYLKTAEQLCKRFGTLFVVDEIQTGLGRTGTLFACEHDDLSPDILVLAKALGGGLFPISACIANDKAWSKHFGQRHSSTFANNHFSASIGLKVLDKLVNDKTVFSNVVEQGDYLKEKLQQLVKEFPDAFASTSGRGFMQGLTLAEWQDKDSYFAGYANGLGHTVPLVASYLLNQHHIVTAPTLNSSTVLRIQPSLLITKAQIDKLIFALCDVGRLITQKYFSAFFSTALGLNNVHRKLPQRVDPTLEVDIDKLRQPKLGTFAFFMHETTELDVIESMPGGISAYDNDEIERIKQWVELFKPTQTRASPIFHIPCVPSKQGSYVDGWLIAYLISPREMMRLSKTEKISLINSYIDAAKSKGVDVIGLGAFTSVITRGGTLLGDCDIPVTTGNSFTALSCTDGIRKLCRSMGRSLSDSNLAVVGAAGSVGRLSTLDLGPACQRVTLIGNARHKSDLTKLEAVAGELIVELMCNPHVYGQTTMYQVLQSGGVSKDTLSTLGMLAHDQLGPQEYRQIFEQAQFLYETNLGSLSQFPIVMDNGVDRLLVHCNIVLTATSNGESFIQPEMLAKNAIVCDAARPSDLLAGLKTYREDIFIYEGGLVKLPVAMRFGGPNMTRLDTGITLACLGETIILAMNQISRNYSIGERPSLAEARQIFEWGTEAGFVAHIPDLNEYITQRDNCFHRQAAAQPRSSEMVEFDQVQNV